MTAPHPWELIDQRERRRELEADPEYCRVCRDICRCGVPSLAEIVAGRVWPEPEDDRREDEQADDELAARAAGG